MADPAQGDPLGAQGSGLWLARHGRTAYNDEGRFQGWSDVPLDALGREQAQVLALAVARVAPMLLVASPLTRAAQTAAIVGAHVGLEAVVDERFAETDAGEWTHRSFAEVTAEDPDGFARFMALDLDWGFPGGERFADQHARVLAGVADWRARAVDGGPIVVICHANVIRLALTPPGTLPQEIPGRPENGSLVAL
ncbi:unannotated protein [freshwater metagenome]|uniref:Unannotated protein n=1 Tax=freshwater metagenome TaxID=449393 RepID=A0A6J7HE45_9ZZZZ|nr:histidine phosphatase family protein [Actinomycetota bacterium]